MGEFTSFKFLHTTTVDVQKSASEIMGILGRMGAQNVSMEMEGGEPVGMTFAVTLADQRMCYRLPVRWEPIYEAMLKEINAKRGSWRTSSTDRQAKAKAQARRTAWRIALEWLKVQCAFVSHGIKTAQEVFLSDMLRRGPDGQITTVGEMLLTKQGMMLLTGGGEP